MPPPTLSETGKPNGWKMLTGSMVACGTNWATTPATGVPWPSKVLDSTLPPVVGPAAAAAAGTAAAATGPPVPVARGGEVLVAQSAGPDVRARGDPAAERRRDGVDAGVDDRHGAVLAVVGHAQRPQVVQADQGAGGRAGQAGRGLELPDAVVVRRVEGRAVGREGDAEARVDEALASCRPEVSKPSANALTTPVRA